jgi:hypothetical protein
MKTIADESLRKAVPVELWQIKCISLELKDGHS